MNPFSTHYKHDTPDSILVSEILDGNKQSLNGLILRHQPFIYNIAWKMIGDPLKAEDLTQEALLKIISNLSSFKGESPFRTWAYRIVRNHFLNDRKKPDQKKWLASMAASGLDVDIWRMPDDWPIAVAQLSFGRASPEQSLL